MSAAELTVSFRASVARLRAYVVREFALWLGGSSASVFCELLVILRGPDVHDLWTDVHCNKKKILIRIQKTMCMFQLFVSAVPHRKSLQNNP